MRKWHVLFFGFVALFCVLGMPLSYAEDDDCANDDEDCTDPCDCPEGGENPFSVYSGNATREIADIKLPIQFGDMPLQFSRYFQSRPEWNATSRKDMYFGQGGNWRHEFQWTIMDDGLKNGEQSIQVINPKGESRFYYKKTPGDLFMTERPAIHSRVLPDGTNYWLYRLDGTCFHITEKEINSNKIFRMEGFQDPYLNRYEFVYNTNDVLQRVVAPNTNHWFEFSYIRFTNAVDPGGIRFSYVNTNAIQVLVPGTWNDWTGTNTQMTLSNGVWYADVELEQGFYQYKFLVTDSSTNDHWLNDPDNSLVVGPSSNSLVIVDDNLLLSRIDASDGRNVEYSYEWFWNDANGVLDACLTGAAYTTNITAKYTYYPASYDQGRMALMKSADDPMYSGAGRAVWYKYHTNSLYSGQIYEERSLVNSQLFGRLEFDDARPGYRRLTDANGDVTEFQYSTSAARLLSKTNAVGYTYKNIYYGGDGMLWKRIDPLGRTSVYTRTWHFGAVLSISNSSCDCVADEVNTYTDNTYPFYLATKTDAEGYVTSYTRDENHRPTRIDYPDGTYETFDYNTNGQVLVERQRNGGVWNYTYDPRGRKTSEQAPDGGMATYVYNDTDQLIAMTNALGYVTQYQYDWRGSITNTTFPDSTRETICYDFYGMETQRVDRAGGITVKQYNEYGRLMSITTPSGAAESWITAPSGRQLSQTTADGLIISNYYDGIGRRIRETYSSDGTEKLWFYSPNGVTAEVSRLGFPTFRSYNSEGRMDTFTDARGNTTYYTYDNLGRKITEVNAISQTNEYTYDAAGRVLTRLTSLGLNTNTYNSNGQLIRQVRPGGITNENIYEESGRIVARIQNGFLIQSNRYNELGQLTWSMNADGLVTSNVYNEVGQSVRTCMPDGSYVENVYSNTFLAQRIDRADRVTTYVRDNSGRVITEIDNAGRSVHYSYTPSGYMTNMIDKAGNHTVWTFDTEGRQTAKRYADGTVWQYEYDAEGHMISRMDAKNQTTIYRYDPNGNVTNIDYATDADIFYNYDALNRKTSMVDGLGTTEYTYVDCCSSLETEDGPFANDTLNYSYDVAGRLVGVATPFDSVSYGYDSLSRLEIITAAEGEYGYSYLANGNIETGLLRPNGVQTLKQYDLLNRLTNLVNKAPGNTIISSYGITLNNADLRTKILREDGRRIEYSYDPIGQLQGASGIMPNDDPWPGYQFGYQYDAAGNPLKQTRNGLVRTNSFNHLNQNRTTELGGALCVVGAVNYTNGTVAVNGQDGYVFADGSFAATNVPFLDGTNTLAAIHNGPYGRTATNTGTVIAQDRSYGYDQNGNMTNDGVFVYTWNNENRLVEVRKVSDLSLVQQNNYDGLGRRRQKVVYLSDETITNCYLYRGWLVVAVTDGENNVLERYTHGRDLSGSFEGAGGVGGIVSVKTASSTNYYQYDFNGNVSGLTDQAGELTARYEYSPFGEVLLHFGDTNARFQFCTKEYDEMANLNYFGYRSYSPSLGRWINRDPLEELESINLYAFVRNQPNVSYDFLGLNTVTVPTTYCGEQSFTAPGVTQDDIDKYYGGKLNQPPRTDTWSWQRTCKYCRDEIEYKRTYTFAVTMTISRKLSLSSMSWAYEWTIDKVVMTKEGGEKEVESEKKCCTEE